MENRGPDNNFRRNYQQQSHNSSPYQRPRGRGRGAPFGSGERGRDHFHRGPESSNRSDSFSQNFPSYRRYQDSRQPAGGFQQCTKFSSTGGVRAGITQLSSNFIKLDLLNPDQRITQYDVSFEPEVDDKLRRFKLINLHFRTLGENVVKVYDHGHLLWSPIKTEEEETSGTYELKDGEKVRVCLKRKNQCKICECRLVLGVIIKRIMSNSQFIQIRRSYFNPDLRHLIPEHRLELWPGFVSGVEEYDGGVLLNIDNSFKVLQNNTIHSILSNLLQVTSSGSVFNEEIQKSVIGMIAITRYNNRTIRIDDIDFESNPLSTFERKGEKITFVDYYKQQYNLEIQDLKQPLLISRLRKKQMGKETEDVLNLYVPELCYATGLFTDQKSNFRLMKELALITQQTPEKRNRELTRFLQNVNENENCKRLLNEWGLKIPEHSITVEGRILEPEKIHFGSNRLVQEPNADWGRSLAREKILNAVPLDIWAVMYTSRDERITNTFCFKTVEVCQRFGIPCREPTLKIKLENDRPESYVNQLRTVKGVKMIVIIFPSRRDDRYITIKKLAHEMGLPSQVIITKTLLNPQRLDGVVTKVVLQMNCKIGGVLWGVDMPNSEDGLMICGLESSRPLTPGASAVALVTSVNKDATRWTSSGTLTPPGQYIFDNLRELFVPCLREWHKFNNEYPRRIILYRVGISDGQLENIKNLEVNQIQQVCKELQIDPPPALSFIIVRSRTNSRYYTKQVNGSLENPPPGTVLDHTITKQNMNDFYLVSPSVRQGTVSPTHYVILENTSDMSFQLLQLITFKLCHLYYNWSATVRIPAVCQYASKLAQQMSLRINPPKDAEMRNTLYFL